MLKDISREHFKVDIAFPAIQTGVASLGAQALGRLGHFTVTPQATVLISLSAFLVASLAKNFFESPLYQYLSIPAGTAAGILAHRFLYPAKGVFAVIGIKEFLILNAVLVIVKFAGEDLHRLRMSEDEAAHQIGQKGADAVIAAEEQIGKGLEHLGHSLEKIGEKLHKNRTE